jgi:hypothetical protein
MSTTQQGRRVSDVFTRFIVRGKACSTNSSWARRHMSLFRSLWTRTAVVLSSVSATPAAPLDPLQLSVDVLFNLDPPGRISTKPLWHHLPC